MVNKQPTYGELSNWTKSRIENLQSYISLKSIDLKC